MIRVSIRAAIKFSASLDCKTDDEAIRIAKEHMDAAVMRVALDLRMAGYDAVDVEANGTCIAHGES